MKRIKLFKSFVFENYSRGKSVKFNMPDLFEMPNGLSKNKIYVVGLNYECENLIYALVNYTQLEKIYESLNLNLISKKIDSYSRMIYTEKKYEQSDPLYDYKLLNRKSWNIKILAESESNMFPYYVYVLGKSDPSQIVKKINDLPKCRVCGEDPDVLNLSPGEITCSIGSDSVVFDPEMGMKLSDIIYDDSGTHESPSDDDHLYKGRGYYIRFDSLGAFLETVNPAYQFARFRKVGGNFVVDNLKIFEVLPYKPDLVRTRELISKREGYRDFLDDIFEYLIFDQKTPQPIIKAISDILNPEDYHIDKFDYHRVECHNYVKMLLSWKTGEYAKYPEFENGRFFIALPSDKSIVDAFLNKIPKDYNEIYDGLDSLDKSILKKYITSDHTFDSFMEVLKYSIYLVNPNSITKEQARLYDGELPPYDTLEGETHCNFFYGIYKKITLSEINKLTPIELYLEVFYNRFYDS